jgi:hypothetical protein
MFLGIIFAMTGTAEDQEGSIRSNLRMDIRTFADAEGK